jgi:hypothetical protein
LFSLTIPLPWFASVRRRVSALPLLRILSAPAEAATAMTADAPVHGRASCAMSLELATIYVSGACFAR